jgi:hypothetical protein
MKKYYITLAVLILLILVAVLTNPDQNRHKEVVKDKLITYLQKSLKKDQTKPNDEYEEDVQALGIMLGGMIVEKVLDNFMSTDNYVVFSTSKITWHGGKKIIGIGAFGNVFLTKELDEALNKGLLND